MGALIVNADDFGLTSGVNRAIKELHTAGLVTSTSLIARAGATEEAIDLAVRTPTLGVGCHVVLVDGEPVLPPKRIPTLVDPKTGQFPNSLATFLHRLFRGRISRVEMEAEMSAQIAFLQQRGVHLTHVDTHKHTHVFSAVLRPLLRVARAAGIRAVRNPFEPHWSTRAMRRAHAATLRSLLQCLPAGKWELVTHPGYNDADLERVPTRLRATRDVERAALAALKEFPAIKLISFAGLSSDPLDH